MLEGREEVLELVEADQLGFALHIARREAGGLGGLSDFWLFDSRTVARFHFEGDRTVGMELVTDPVEVLRACQVRDAAWHYATRHADFRAQLPEVGGGS
ncbi:DUF6879 family protein [Kitasatospora sp. NPDC127059]|uniref:DUF6879 family protein n=1 Tax=unclassified Kitasatospora TaxID=2633591 RepID=UPI00366A547C